MTTVAGSPHFRAARLPVIRDRTPAGIVTSFLLRGTLEARLPPEGASPRHDHPCSVFHVRKGAPGGNRPRRRRCRIRVGAGAAYVAPRDCPLSELCPNPRRIHGRSLATSGTPTSTSCAPATRSSASRAGGMPSERPLPSGGGPHLQPLGPPFLSPYSAVSNP